MDEHAEPTHEGGQEEERGPDAEAAATGAERREDGPGRPPASEEDTGAEGVAPPDGAGKGTAPGNPPDPGEEVRGRLTAGLRGLLMLYGDEALVQLPGVVEALRPGALGRYYDRWEARGPAASEDDIFFASGSPADQLPPDPSPPPRIYFGIYVGAVTLLVGETGAGKSSMIYNMAVHAALDKPLWGIAFGLGRPIRVWYLDPENARLQAAWKLKNIGMGLPPDLVIDPALGANLSRAAHQESFYRRIVRDKIDLVILDPMVNLFATADENNNAEAVQQMVFLEHVAQETGTAVLLVHHTGKMEGGSGAYGRGASARLASAAVGMVWRSRSDDQADDTFRPDQPEVPRHDECRLQVGKNRLGGQGSLYLKMIGSDRFGLSSVDAWRQATGKALARADRRTKIEIAVEAIDDFVMAGDWHTRAEIIAAMAEEGVGETNVDKALKQMASDHDLRVKKGPRNTLLYAWPQWVASGDATVGDPDAEASGTDADVSDSGSPGVEDPL